MKTLNHHEMTEIEEMLFSIVNKTLKHFEVEAMPEEVANFVMNELY